MTLKINFCILFIPFLNERQMMKSTVRKVGRPRLTKDESMCSSVTLRFTPHQSELIDLACAEFRVPRSRFIRYVMYKYLKELAPFLEGEDASTSPSYYQSVLRLYDESKRIAEFD